MLTAKEVQSHFTEVLRTYGLRDWEVVLREGAIADCSLGRKTIILRADATFSRERTEGLVAHEIETHVLTSENAERQPYEVFQRCAGYLETQEGLAVINQNRFLPEDHEKRYWPALGALAVHHGRTHSFADLRASIRRHGFDDSRALRTCLKVKRGMGNTALPGVFTKELLYFRGGQVVRKFLDEGGDIRELYIGKIALQDLPLVHQVKGVIDPVYMPKFILV